MTGYTRRLLITGCLLVATAILLGAFGAHGVKSLITEENLTVYKTGVYYHMIHGLGILLLGILSFHLPPENIKWSVYLILLGIIFFSGSLYLLSTRSVTGINWSFLGPMTPIGGLCFVAAWLLLVFKWIKNN